MRALLITNNAKVKELFPVKGVELFLDESRSLFDILLLIRDYVHRGHKLLTHPLSGSVKPFETPFKSVLISAIPTESSTPYDSESLRIIEDAIVLSKNFHNHKLEFYNEKILNDFRCIDFELIKSGVESMPKY